MKGYKGMTKEMTCRGMKFEVGKTYHVDGEIEICRNGLHFCKNLIDVFEYYDRDLSRFFEIEAEEPILSEGNKSVTANMSITRELSGDEINRSFYGYGNGSGTGYGYEYGSGDGYGCGYRCGHGDGSGSGTGCGYGYGDGLGYGYGDGSGSGTGYGYGSGSGTGYGDGIDNIQKILLYKE